MGFKIESLSTMASIANGLSNTATSATSRLTQTASALDELVSNVKGQGIDTTLNSLKSGLQTSGNSAVNLLNEVSAFITSQVGSYTTNEETIINELNQIDNALESLEV